MKYSQSEVGETAVNGKSFIDFSDRRNTTASLPETL